MTHKTSSGSVTHVTAGSARQTRRGHAWPAWLTCSHCIVRRSIVISSALVVLSRPYIYVCNSGTRQWVQYSRNLWARVDALSWGGRHERGMWRRGQRSTCDRIICWRNTWCGHVARRLLATFLAGDKLRGVFSRVPGRDNTALPGRPGDAKWHSALPGSRFPCGTRENTNELLTVELSAAVNAVRSSWPVAAKDNGNQDRHLRLA
jgi:hypothetical protein